MKFLTFLGVQESQWSRYVIVIRRKHITFCLNFKVVSEFVDAFVLKGPWDCILFSVSPSLCSGWIVPLCLLGSAL